VISHTLSPSLLLLHAADALLGIGIVIFFCIALLLLLSAVASRSGTEGRHHRGSIGGLNRAERRKERAMSKRKR
jgi:hypothetical protein